MTRATLRHSKRADLERLARWLGVARPEILKFGLLVQEVLRRVGRRGL